VTPGREIVRDQGGGIRGGSGRISRCRRSAWRNDGRRDGKTRWLRLIDAENGLRAKP
jgi:hypothetical protein